MNRTAFSNKWLRVGKSSVTKCRIVGERENGNGNGYLDVEQRVFRETCEKQRRGAAPHRCGAVRLSVENEIAILRGKIHENEKQESENDHLAALAKRLDANRQRRKLNGRVVTRTRYMPNAILAIIVPTYAKLARIPPSRNFESPIVRS